MENVFTKLARGALDLLLPLNCAVCHREGRVLCEGCEQALPALEDPYCTVCADPGPLRLCRSCAYSPLEVDGIRAPYLYEGPVRELIHALKYGNVRAAAPELGWLLALYMESLDLRPDVLVPVPLHRRRERERGYNQSELLAKGLSERAYVPAQPELLRRTRNSPPQVAMRGPEERRRNIEGTFESPSQLNAVTVVLIDDVVTTGSTMSACAAALKDAGAGSVWGVALARQRPLTRGHQPGHVGR